MALVVGYHVAPAAVPGGFLGVDVFFVLSGFLITSLLLDEARAEASIDIATFYVRRLRGWPPPSWSCWRRARSTPRCGRPRVK